MTLSPKSNGELRLGVGKFVRSLLDAFTNHPARSPRLGASAASGGFLCGWRQLGLGVSAFPAISVGLGRIMSGWVSMHRSGCQSPAVPRGGVVLLGWNEGKVVQSTNISKRLFLLAAIVGIVNFGLLHGCQPEPRAVDCIRCHRQRDGTKQIP